MNKIDKILGYADEREALLAKVLATENISVVNDPKAETASFDVGRRILYLPVIEAPIETRFLFVFHEISHALFTPVTEKCSNNVYNVVEDVRVDSKITMKYPGARRFYSEGIKFLVERGFFGEPNKIVNDFALASPNNFIHRVNLYSKIRYWEDNNILPSFEDAFPIERERELFAMIDSAVTFDDVEECVAAVLEYINGDSNQKENGENIVEDDGQIDISSMDDDGVDETEEDMETANGDSAITLEVEKTADGEANENENGASSDDSGEFGEGNGEGGDLPSDSSGDLSEDEDDKREGGGIDGLDDVEDVDDVYKKAMSALISQECFYDDTAVIGNIRFKRKIPTIIDILDALIEDDKSQLFVEREMIAKNVKVFKKAAANMAKEFQLRQRSRSYASRSMRNSGQIDPNLLSSYKFSEDIFKSIVVEKKGNNYGLVLVVDRSSSMSKTIYSVYQQVALLAEFCRLVGIKLVVYGYTSMNKFKRRSSWFVDNVEMENEVDGKMASFGIIELISTDMPSKEFRAALSVLVNGFGSFGIIEGMGQTPTNDTLIALAHVIRKWKEKNRIDICRTFLFTDGINNKNNFLGYSSIVVDTKTRRRYNLYGGMSEEERRSYYSHYHVSDYRTIAAYDIYRSRSGSGLSVVMIEMTNKRLNYAFSEIGVSPNNENDADSLSMARKKVKNGEFYKVYSGNDIGKKARGVLDNVAVALWNVKSVEGSSAGDANYESVKEAVRSLRERSYMFAALRNISSMYIDLLV